MHLIDFANQSRLSLKRLGRAARNVVLKGHTNILLEYDDELGFADIFLQSILVYHLGVLVEATFLHDGDITY